MFPRMSKMIDTGRCSFGLLGLLAAVVLVSPAKTADIVKSTGADQQTTITFTGTIVEGDALKFSRLLTRKHPVTVVKLNSRGGNIAEATKIAAMVRNANITTALRAVRCVTRHAFSFSRLANRNLPNLAPRSGFTQLAIT